MSSELFGFLNILKPPGMTSHDVVQVVRRTCDTRRVGHTGTLDPVAAGVLALAIGPATRLAEFVEATDKAYRAEITLGLTTDTYDAEGQVTARQSAAGLTGDMLADVLAGLTGDIEMRPPAHSAISVGGRRLYDMARAGQAVEAPLRRVTIHELRLLEFMPGETATALVDVTCSKGTYIRSLADMIGSRLGCGGTLSMLLRTRVGSMSIEQSVTLEELAEGPCAHLLPVPEALDYMPQVRVSDDDAEILRRGQVVRVEGGRDGAVLVLDQRGEVICLAETAPGLLLQPRKVFARSGGV